MRVTVTAQGCEIPDELRERAREVMDRLAKYAHRPHSARVIFMQNGIARHAEVRLEAARNELFKASGDGPDFRTALDRARAKVRRQLDSAQREASRARKRA